MNHKLIGLSFAVPEDAKKLPYMNATEVRYERLMEHWLKNVTGMTDDQINDDKTMDSYLSSEWSYIRMERFIGKSGVDRKAVQYHMTPRQLLDRIRYLGREIHSNFWINALFSNEQNTDWVITDVNYPNEADGIVDRGGVVYRINHDPMPLNFKPTQISRYPNFTGVFTTDGSTKSLEEILSKIL